MSGKYFKITKKSIKEYTQGGILTRRLTLRKTITTPQTFVCRAILPTLTLYKSPCKSLLLYLGRKNKNL